MLRRDLEDYLKRCDTEQKTKATESNIARDRFRKGTFFNSLTYGGLAITFKLKLKSFNAFRMSYES